MTDQALPIAVTMGDPAGCGPQITAAAWRALGASPRHGFYVSGSPAVFEDYAPIRIIDRPENAAEVFANALPVLPLAEDGPVAVTGVPARNAATSIIASIDATVADARAGRAAAVVTNPINKALLYNAGFTHPGHTEYIARLCAEPGADPPRPVMMLAGGGLRVALATIHIPLRDVAASLSTASLVEIAGITATALRRDFGVPKPRLAFTGLNPHAGEGGAIGREELEVINPAAAALRGNGIDISDARPGDTVFAEALSGAFDAVIAMTHDQGLIPVKTLDFWGGVNTTLGLPIIRTSPDHGTAYEAAAKAEARADSLIAAIRLARDMSDRRALTYD